MVSQTPKDVAQPIRGNRIKRIKRETQRVPDLEGQTLEKDDQLPWLQVAQCQKPH